MDEIMDHLWQSNLQDAKDGNDDAATYVLDVLAICLAGGDASKAQINHVSNALARIAEAPPGKERIRATKVHLLLGRRAGGQTQYVAKKNEFRRAAYMWDLKGDVPDAGLEQACIDVLDMDSDEASDTRALKRAYLKHRPWLRLYWPRKASNSK